MLAGGEEGEALTSGPNLCPRDCPAEFLLLPAGLGLSEAASNGCPGKAGVEVRL